MKRVLGFRLHKLSNNRSQKFVYVYQVCSNDQVARVFGNSHATFEVLEVDKKLEGIVMLIRKIMPLNDNPYKNVLWKEVCIKEFSVRVHPMYT